jgi:hypothetical protein
MCKEMIIKFAAFMPSLVNETLESRESNMWQIWTATVFYRNTLCGSKHFI